MRTRKRAGLELNGVWAISGAVFVLISFCSKGGTTTKRGETKTKTKRTRKALFSSSLGEEGKAE
eukprot:8673949-Pyramimonas_sp.AAC.1